MERFKPRFQDIGISRIGYMRANVAKIDKVSPKPVAVKTETIGPVVMSGVHFI